MVRKLLVFVVMLVHVNGSMFMPQGAEQDVYNAQGQQQKDINTVIEYIDEVCLNHHQNNPVDQDNDQGQNFHLVKLIDYYYVPDLTPVKQRISTAASKPHFAVFADAGIPSVTLDILAPPPKA